MIKSLLVISAGASAGAAVRWGLGLTLNSMFPLIPLGTLVANMLGGGRVRGIQRDGVSLRHVLFEVRLFRTHLAWIVSTTKRPMRGFAQTLRPRHTSQ